MLGGEQKSNDMDDGRELATTTYWLKINYGSKRKENRGKIT